uniref:hypothetical protein n=1 Tax=Paraburkholderia fungorum TaxID=134537 RepID=UPI0021B2D6A5|nr:hypothetical protein [Paraburkholderia fungorum]
MLKFVCEMPVSFDVEAGTAPLLETAAADEAPVAGRTAFVEGLTGAAGEPPIPCFCNSISTRFFSASNCCRLDTCARGCDADCAAAVAGVAAVAADAPSAASLAEGWIAPDQTWAPLPATRPQLVSPPLALPEPSPPLSSCPAQPDWLQPSSCPLLKPPPWLVLPREPRHLPRLQQRH